MFAVLGDVPFQIVGSPEAFSDSRGYDYAEHRVVQARPRLQWLADDLMTIRLEMLLHGSFTVPAVSLLALRQAAESHTALPLVFGNGNFRGYFVVTQIETLSRQFSGSGDIFAITVSLRLRESPIEFDPAASAIPDFVPIAISAAFTSSILGGAVASNGVSALTAISSPSGATGSTLLPGDVLPSVIVRSAA